MTSMQTQPFNNSFPGSQPPKPNIFTGSNSVAIYTVLRILVKMHRTLGLEAMLEYTGKYISIMEERDPVLEPAVSKALCLMSIEKIYKEAFIHEK